MKKKIDLKISLFSTLRKTGNMIIINVRIMLFFQLNLKEFSSLHPKQMS